MGKNFAVFIIFLPSEHKISHQNKSPLNKTDQNKKLEIIHFVFYTNMRLYRELFCVFGVFAKRAQNMPSKFVASINMSSF